MNDRFNRVLQSNNNQLRVQTACFDCRCLLLNCFLLHIRVLLLWKMEGKKGGNGRGGDKKGEKKLNSAGKNEVGSGNKLEDWKRQKICDTKTVVLKDKVSNIYKICQIDFQFSLF